MNILLIDNYDSFTYNLSQYLEEEGGDDVEVTVWRNDQFGLDDVERFDKIVLSPGPGVPDEAGLLKAVIRRYAPTKPILGVCLGEQAIGEVFGAEIYNLNTVFHGIQSSVRIVASDYIFDNLSDSIKVGRYHSWVVGKEDFPAELEVTAVSDEGQVMALKHRRYDVHGIQFHPESILTPEGRTIIRNFIYGCC
ncbi:anthranilate synthase component II [Prevotella sp.]|uniref:anthranilate synthase component II n=1 Tax=uncultured Prevotella sp. TaxID=159272 RepID=UPI0025F4FEF6|nr:aminodeoxychorismate/anthranilate synthase component II [Prevotella sp.]